MPLFQKPENALKRAQELKDVGKPELALDVLHDLITSRRHRSWTKVHEQIMIEYINLCVDMRKSHHAKDGLHQYKNIVSTTALASLEVVIRHYIKAAEERVESARGELDKVVLDFDDLEASETPEGLLLMMVSEEDTKERTDRAVLTPWLKFLWEAYRTVLDILRNNARLENLYQSISQLALQFCLKYERKPEFHRLCDLLRYHLQQVLKYQTTASINLNTQESFNAHLQTRFIQLDVASKLELWQEAFKAIEDISYLMEVSNKSPKPQMLADYYSKLAMVFWRSQQYLYLAASLLKLFQLSKDQKKSFSQEEAQSLASSVLLAVLSCPLKSTQDNLLSPVPLNEFGVRETVTDRNLRLVTLLGVDGVPTREGLIQEMTAANILNYADPELRGLYSLIERQFHPLDLCKKVVPIFDHISRNENLVQYVQPLQSIVTMRLLKQLSQVYASMNIARVCQLIPFYTEFQIEQFLVRAVKDRLLQVRVCHRTRSIHFATNVFIAETDSSTQEGPQLQLLQSQMMTSQLTTISRRLRDAVDMIDPAENEKIAAAHRASVYEGITSRIRAEHRAALERKGIIESHKEQMEKEARRIEEAKQLARDEETKKKKQKEDEEAVKAANDRKETEIQERAKLQNREFLLGLLKTAAGQKLLEHLSMDELERMEPDALTRYQIEILEKERRDQQSKLKTQEKRVDYLERAKRKEELPLLKESWEKNVAESTRQWQQEQAAKIENAKKEHEAALEQRARLRPMVAYKDTFIAGVMQRRKAAFDAEMVAYTAQRKKHEEALKQAQEEQARKEREHQERMRKEAEEEDARRQAEAEREQAEFERAEQQAKEAKEREEERQKAERAASEAAAARPTKYVPPVARRDEGRDEGRREEGRGYGRDEGRGGYGRDEGRGEGRGGYGRDEGRGYGEGRSEGRSGYGRDEGRGFGGRDEGRGGYGRDEGRSFGGRDEGRGYGGRDEGRRDDSRSFGGSRDEGRFGRPREDREESGGGRWRDSERPAYRAGDRDREEGGSRSGGAYRPPERREEGGARSGGAYRPPGDRDREEGGARSGGAYRPPGDRDREEGGARSGGAYRPPGSRSQQPEGGSANPTDKPVDKPADRPEGWTTVARK